jgi:PAS domain-containing protein
MWASRRKFAPHEAGFTNDNNRSIRTEAGKINFIRLFSSARKRSIHPWPELNRLSLQRPVLMKSAKRASLSQSAKSLREKNAKRKRAQNDLVESEQRLRSVLQCTPVPGFVIGRNHKVIYWNRALEELYKE